MKKLTRSQLIKVLSYDPKSGLFTWRMSGSGRKLGQPAGCVTSLGYRRIHVFGRSYWAHHLAWLYSKGSLPGEEVDHINGVKTDDRIENLRPCTRAQNARNRKRAKNNRSGATGVYFHPRRRRWIAQIYLNRKSIIVGRCHSFDDAVVARRKAEAHYFGIFAPTPR